MIPFFDLKSNLLNQKNSIHKSIDALIDSGVTIGGESVEKFEREFADYLGVNDFVGVGNGLDALRLSLIALGIGPGDEVIVPAFTFIATWLAVTQCGATPIPADVSLTTAGMNLESLPYSSRTKAVIYVHLFGIAEDLSALRISLDSKGIHLIEDAAQAHGAVIAGKSAGSFGVAGCFSFYPTKNLGALGDAGGIASNDPEFSKRIRSLRSYGSGKTKYDHELAGWNSRLDSFQALHLSSQLLHLDELNERRRVISKKYLESIKFNEKVTPLSRNLSNANVWHHFVLQVRNSRDTYRNFLSENGVSTEIHYPEPAYSAKCFEGKRSDKFANSNLIASSCVSIPIYPWLLDSQVDFVIEVVNKANEKWSD